MNALTEAGGVSYLTEIIEFVPTASNVDYYIQRSRKTSLFKRTNRYCNQHSNTGL